MGLDAAVPGPLFSCNFSREQASHSSQQPCMRILRFALCALFLPLATIRAADDQKEDEKQAPDEIPNFSQLDEYIYVPKTTLSMGTRYFLHGPKTTYSGQGLNPSVVDPGDDASVTVGNISRTYIDGTVSPDERTIPVATGEGATVSTVIPNDGRTNTWAYENSSQLQPNGDINFHTYAGEITDTASHTVSGAPNTGIELIIDRDMGKIGKHFKWTLTGGFSLGDIHSSSYVSVPTTLTTVTDTYDLFGQVPPPGPFSSPNNVTQTVFGPGSVAVLGSGNSTTTQTAAQAILLGNRPLYRTTSYSDIVTTNRYFIEGSYYTLRAGPTLIMPFGKKFNFNISAGPALIYSGAIFNVLEDLDVATGENFTQLYQRENTKLLPGYYVDMNLQYQLTDTAGFYVGNIYQSAGSYVQKVSSGTGTNYAAKIDFGSQDGVKGGITVRF
jgi:hypothetical protein